MQVAVLILTYKRASLLKRCLQSLKINQSENIKIHIYICINGKDDKAKNLLSSSFSDFEMTIIEKDRSVSVGAARNLLIEKVKEQWICFLDDDVYLSDNYFEKAFNFIELNKNKFDIFGGPDRGGKNPTTFQRTLDFVMKSFWATGPTNKRHKSFGSNLLSDASELDLILCNLWMKTEVFKLEKFPEGFKRNEENFLLSKLRDRGIRMCYIPDFFVYHSRKTSFAKLIRVLYLAGVYRSISIIYYPKSIKLVFFIHLTCLLFITIGSVMSVYFLKLTIFVYAVILILLASTTYWKDKNWKVFFYGLGLFFIYHFAYPLGQIHGYNKAILLKIKGEHFE